MAFSPDDAARLPLAPVAGGCEFGVKVVPGASRTRIMGLLADSLKLAIAAPAEGGKANAAVIALLAEVFGIRRQDVQIVAGQTNPAKRVRVTGITEPDVRRRLSSAVG